MPLELNTRMSQQAKLHHGLFENFRLNLMDYRRMHTSKQDASAGRTNYPGLFRNAIENLLGSLTRLTSVPERDILHAEQQLGMTFPKVLREYYASVGGIDEINLVYNQLLMPKACFVERGRIAFLQEKDSQVYWGVRLDQPDASALVMERGQNGLMHWMWKRKQIECIDFLLVHIHWQAVCGGMAFLATAQSNPQLQTLLQQTWQTVGKLDDLIAFCKPGLAACLIGEGDFQQIYLGARFEPDILNIVTDFETIGVTLTPFTY